MSIFYFNLLHLHNEDAKAHVAQHKVEWNIRLVSFNNTALVAKIWSTFDRHHVSKKKYFSLQKQCQKLVLKRSSLLIVTYAHVEEQPSANSPSFPPGPGHFSFPWALWLEQQKLVAHRSRLFNWVMSRRSKPNLATNAVASNLWSNFLVWASHRPIEILKGVLLFEKNGVVIIFHYVPCASTHLFHQ